MSSVALNSRVRTIERRVVVSVLPRLDEEPDRRADLLRGCEPIDLYLIAVGSLDDLVVRHDQRRDAIRTLAGQAEWSPRTLRQTALRARMARYVRHGRLTAKGWAQAVDVAARLAELEAA
jgi:hypothetical protein